MTSLASPASILATAGVQALAGGFGGFGGFSGDMGDIGSIFEDFFGGGFGGGRRSANPNAPRRGSDIQCADFHLVYGCLQGCDQEDQRYPHRTVQGM